MNYIRNIIGQVLISLGSLFILVPVYSLLHSDFKWQPVMFALIIGVILLFVGTIILKQPKLRTRPRYWAPALSGAISSACTLLLFVALIVVYRMTAKKAPDWLILVMFFLSVVAIVAAITCIATLITAAVKSDPQKDNEKGDVLFP